MMVQFEKRNNSAAELRGATQDETAARPDIISALSGFEALCYTDADLQKRLNEALDENKKNEATIMRLREQIHRHQAQERSMAAQIIQLSMDLAMAKAEADRQQLNLSPLEQQPKLSPLEQQSQEEQPQECILHTALKSAPKESNQIAPLDRVPCRTRSRHLRSKSLNIPSNFAAHMVDMDVDTEDTVSNNMGSNTNLFLSMGRRIGNLDSSFRSLRQSLLMGSMHSESSSEKIKSLSGSMNKSLHSIATDGPFDCDNNSSIDWPDEVLSDE
mmetsp:Transcript_27811/g.41868  ORF Transcript_27811/g.41868 Transcript_27811/m.41868 type:complete len:272 (+) Transcript_27811:2-817(+)|eukprot:scaffold26879_cov126-Skeletonema_dohrnii-CCMP3373.AAC.4